MPQLSSRGCRSALDGEGHHLAPLWPVFAPRFSKTRSSFNSFLSGSVPPFAETLPGPNDQALGLPEYSVPSLGPSGADAQPGDTDPMVVDMEVSEQHEPADASALPDMVYPESLTDPDGHDTFAPGNPEDPESVMGPDFGSAGVANGMPKMTGSASGTGVLEFWSTEGAAGGGAKLLTDGEGADRAVVDTSAHQEHHQEESPSHNPHDDSKAHINPHHEEPVKARHVDQHLGQERGDHADVDSHAKKREDEPVGAVIMNNAEDKSIHLVPILGGLVAVFGQLYMWGTVFITLCKPARPASLALPVSLPQSGQPSAAAVGTFSGAAGRPGTSGTPTAPSSTPS